MRSIRRGDNGPAVAEIGSILVGLELLETPSEVFDGAMDTGVRAFQQSRGIGTALMSAAEEHVCARGLNAIVLGVEDANPHARRLYERLGYVEFARDEFKYVGAPVPNPGSWLLKELSC